MRGTYEEELCILVASSMELFQQNVYYCDVHECSWLAKPMNCSAIMCNAKGRGRHEPDAIAVRTAVVISPPELLETPA